MLSRTQDCSIEFIHILCKVNFSCVEPWRLECSPKTQQWTEKCLAWKGRLTPHGRWLALLNNTILWSLFQALGLSSFSLQYWVRASHHELGNDNYGFLHRRYRVLNISSIHVNRIVVMSFQLSFVWYFIYYTRNKYPIGILITPVITRTGLYFYILNNIHLFNQSINQ